MPADAASPPSRGGDVGVLERCCSGEGAAPSEERPESPPAAAAAAAAAEEASPPLRVCVLEREELVFSYPADDSLVKGVAPLLHNAYVHSRRVVGECAEVVHLQRAGAAVKAVFIMLPEDDTDGDGAAPPPPPAASSKRKTRDVLFCCLWTVGEPGGGQVPASLRLRRAVGSGRVTVSPAAAVAGGGGGSGGGGGLEIEGVGRVGRVLAGDGGATLFFPDVGVDVAVTREEGAAVQRMADAAGGVKHNVRLRAPPLETGDAVAATGALLDSVLLLYPTLPAACAEGDTLRKYLSEVVRRRGSGAASGRAQTRTLRPEVSAEVAALLQRAHEAADLVALPGTLPTTARYVPAGEVVCLDGQIVASTLPDRLARAVVYYLRGVGFGDAEARGAEDVLVDTVVLGEAGSRGEEGLLAACRRDAVWVASVSAPARHRGLGSTAVELAAAAKRAAEALLEEGTGPFFSPRHIGGAAGAASAAARAEALAAPTLPPGVVAYEVACGGFVTRSAAKGHAEGGALLDASAPFARKQLAASGLTELSFTAHAPKSKQGYTVAAWRPKEASAFVVVVHEPSCSPSLSGLYCSVVSAMSA